LEEIVENEYNLNIPRHVDTFEEEEPVDLDAVVAELKYIEAEIEGVDKRFVEQCIEQGIEQGIETTALRMLGEGMTEELVAKVTGISVEKIRILKDSN